MNVVALVDKENSEVVVCRCSSDSAFHQRTSTSTSSSTQTLPDAGSSTCLDLQALDVHETRKMRDDSKIHHIVDDLISRPRKLVSIGSFVLIIMWTICCDPDYKYTFFESYSAIVIS